MLEGGRVVELGTHDELMALGGRYAALADAELDPDAAEANTALVTA